MNINGFSNKCLPKYPSSCLKTYICFAAGLAGKENGFDSSKVEFLYVFLEKIERVSNKTNLFVNMEREVKIFMKRRLIK